MEKNRGQKSIIWCGYRYKLEGTLKTGDISWRCSKFKPQCKARIRTDAECSTIISQKMSIHTHRMNKKQSGTTSDVGRQKSYEAKSRLLVKKRYSLMIIRARAKVCLINEQSLSWLTEGASIHRYTDNPLKGLFFIALKCPHFCHSNVRFFLLICPLNPLKCPSPIGGCDLVSASN